LAAVMSELAAAGVRIEGLDPAVTPWHPEHCPRRLKRVVQWSLRCRERCTMLAGWNGYAMRSHVPCPKCKFRFIWRTSTYSLSSSADVRNYGACANPSCRHTWVDWS